MYEVIESTVWRSNSGRTVSPYGALPWLTDAQKIAEGWELVKTGFTVRNNSTNTVGIGREAWQTREQAQEWVDARHAEHRASVEYTSAHSWFVVRKLDYLKTPKYGVTVCNDQGGSSGNGADMRTLKAAAGYIWSNWREVVTINPAMRVVVETWRGFDANDKPVITTEITDADAFLARSGVTRR